MKLWTIKTSDCVATFDEAHEGKIWSMALTHDGKHLVSGGADSVLNIWTDVSAQDAEDALAARDREKPGDPLAPLFEPHVIELVQCTQRSTVRQAETQCGGLLRDPAGQRRRDRDRATAVLC